MEFAFCLFIILHQKRLQQLISIVYIFKTLSQMIHNFCLIQVDVG